MTEMTYADAPFAIRNDLVSAHVATWDRLSTAGTWFDGATRVAIASETRNVKNCPLCSERKEALSPYALE
ncbi:MAG: alkylhydroperoxidase-related (seleno)protein, partial [Pseudomonadota bacterium]|nr:alkylhydroperoxidase-related (seleno)protein [Pseudomonadota bacterium]